MFFPLIGDAVSTTAGANFAVGLATTGAAGFDSTVAVLCCCSCLTAAASTTTGATLWPTIGGEAGLLMAPTVAFAWLLDWLGEREGDPRC